MTSLTLCSFRLSTVQAADRIVAMDSGRVVEVNHTLLPVFDEFMKPFISVFHGLHLSTKQMGNHKELLSKDGLYARLTRRQADAVV